VLAVGVGVWRLAGGEPLVGDTSVDLGEVILVDGDSATVQHVLHLVNRLDRPLTINAVRPDCGCLATSSDARRTLAPGEAFSLPISFTARPGTRHALINLDLGADGTQSLRVRATGKGQTRLVCANNVIELNQRGAAEFTFSALTYESESPPSVPTIVCDVPFCSTEFLGWTLGYRPRDIHTMPTEWRGRALVNWTSGENGIVEPRVFVRLDPAKPLILTFAGAEAKNASGAATSPGE
jgi:hypothetical protein